jgi:serine/threonine protein kinase
VVKCHDIYSTVNNCYIITEFCNEGDLENFLKKREKLPEEEAIAIFRDIVNGFRVIAESGFLHRDLKPANILLKDKIAKIADFGFAKRASSNPVKEAVNVGSPLYMSPEALKGSIYTVKNDIWSLGVILYEILHGKAPWESSTEKELLEKISRQVFTIDRALSEDLKDFVRKCLVADEARRLSLSEFFNHPFILRITEENGIPRLLRKNTSCNGGEAVREVNFLENKGPETVTLHHRKNPHSKPKTEKQFTSQINFMRYIYRFLEMFPKPEESGVYTLGLRFIATKQMLSLQRALEDAMQSDNVFNFEGWDEFLANKEKFDYYKQVLNDYGMRY